VGQAQDPCEQVVAIEDEPRHHLALENKFVRGFAVEIAPHDHTLCHHHAHDYLMYVACIANIVSAPRDQEPETQLYGDGDCELSPAGMTHVVQNLTDRRFRNLLLESLPKAAELRRGPEPRPTFGSGEPMFEIARAEGIATSRKRFDDPSRGAVYRLSIRQKGHVEISSPAIVASPYEHQIELEEVGGAITKLIRFNDLVWLPPSRSGVVRTPGSSATAIVFQLGSNEEQHSAVPKSEREPLKGVRTRANPI